MMKKTDFIEIIDLINNKQLQKAEHRIYCLKEKKPNLGAQETCELELLDIKILNAKKNYEKAFNRTKQIIEECILYPLPTQMEIYFLYEQLISLEGLKENQKALEKVDELINLFAQEKSRTLEQAEFTILYTTLLERKAKHYQNKGKLDEAEKLYREALTQREKIGHKKLIAESYNSLGVLYFYRGKIDDSLSFMEKSFNIREEIEDLVGMASSIDNIGVIYQEKQELDKALEYATKGLDIRRQLGDQVNIATSLSNIGNIYYSEGDLDKALDYYRQGLQIRKQEQVEEHIAQSLNNIGSVYQLKGDLNQAIDYYLESMKLNEKLGLKIELYQQFNNIGLIMKKKGALDDALDYYKKALEIAETIGNERYKANMLNNIGSIYSNKGELETAISYYNRTEGIYVKIGDEGSLYITDLNKGIMNLKLGQIDKAIALLKKALTRSEKKENLVELADVFFHLIRAILEKDKKEAADYLMEFKIISDSTNNKKIELQYQLVEALVQKTSERKRLKEHARKTFEQIISENIISHEITTMALFNITEILLEELSLSYDPALLNKIEDYLSQLLEIGKNQHSHLIVTESYWLKSKVELLKMNYKQSKEYLIQAHMIAEEKGLTRLSIKISKEIDDILSLIEQWEGITSHSTTIEKRMELSGIHNLITQLSKRRGIKEQEIKQEDAKLLLITDKSGLLVYSEKFDDKKDFSEMLISGFLASLSASLTSFMSEALAGEKPTETTENLPIETIKYKDYSITLSFEDPLLFSYIFEGPSYMALHKLVDFKEKIRQEQKIWKALTKVIKKGRVIEKATEERIRKKTIIFRKN